MWYIAIANAFIYLVRYGVLDWAPTYLKEVKGYDIKEIGWAYFSYEFAAIPGTIFCGWLSDKVFKGRRAITTMIYMVAVAIFVFVYWEFSKTPLMDSICLIAIGFLIYGPVMLIGVHALDLAPKKRPVRLPDLPDFSVISSGPPSLLISVWDMLFRIWAGTGILSCYWWPVPWRSSLLDSRQRKNNI